MKIILFILSELCVLELYIATEMKYELGFLLSSLALFICILFIVKPN